MAQWNSIGKLHYIIISKGIIVLPEDYWKPLYYIVNELSKVLTETKFPLPERGNNIFQFIINFFNQYVLSYFFIWETCWIGR